TTILGASGPCDETERWTPCQAGDDRATVAFVAPSGARPWKLLCRDLGCEAPRPRGERCSAVPHRGRFEKDRFAALFSENAKQPHVKEVNAGIGWSIARPTGRPAGGAEPEVGVHGQASRCPTAEPAGGMPPA